MITLEFLAEQQNRIIAELGTVRDDLTVNSAIKRRIDSTVGHLDAILTAMLDELRALTNPFACATYPQPLERLGPIIPGRPPLDHVHVWTVGANPGAPRICRECGWTIAEVLGTMRGPVT